MPAVDADMGEAFSFNRTVLGRTMSASDLEGFFGKAGRTGNAPADPAKAGGLGASDASAIRLLSERFSGLLYKDYFASFALPARKSYLVISAKLYRWRKIAFFFLSH